MSEPKHDPTARKKKQVKQQGYILESRLFIIGISFISIITLLFTFNYAKNTVFYFYYLASVPLNLKNILWYKVVISLLILNAPIFLMLLSAKVALNPFFSKNPTLGKIRVSFPSVKKNFLFSAFGLLMSIPLIFLGYFLIQHIINSPPSTTKEFFNWYKQKIYIITIIGIIISSLSYFFAWKRFYKKMMMSDEELKKDIKQEQGPIEIKSEIKKRIK